MMKTALSFITVATIATASMPALAAGLNDPGCKPTPARPFPVVVVHGQAGNFEGMSGVTNALVREGYCVYAKNYGFVPGGANGQDHLSNSAGQIAAQVDEVLNRTGAPKVNVIGHSAGVGVLDNLILKKGGASKVHRAVMFGGLHHPYAHFGLVNTLDASLYLPNVLELARKIDPNITIKGLVKIAADAGMLDPGMRATAESGFTADLFDPAYWLDMYGKHSEKPGTIAQLGNSERTLETPDAAPNVCYTNIVAAADLLVGPATGFQDEAPNVENFLLTSSITQNAHNDMLGDPVALSKMVSSLAAPCTPALPKTFARDDLEGVGANDADATKVLEDAVREGNTRTRQPLDLESGCSLGGRSTRATWGAGALFALTAFAGAMRRSFRRNRPQRAEAT